MLAALASLYRLAHPPGGGPRAVPRSPPPLPGRVPAARSIRALGRCRARELLGARRGQQQAGHVVRLRALPNQPDFERERKRSRFDWWSIE